MFLDVRLVAWAIQSRGKKKTRGFFELLNLCLFQLKAYYSNHMTKD